MADACVDGNALLAERAICFLPRIHLNVGECDKLWYVSEIGWSNTPAIAENTDADNVTINSANCFHHFAHGTASGEQIFHHQNLLVVYEFVVTAFDDEIILAVRLGFIGVHAKNFSAIAHELG